MYRFWTVSWQICTKCLVIIDMRQKSYNYSRFIVIFFLAFHVLEQNRAFVMALAARFLFVLKMNTFSQFNVKRTCFASNKLSNIILFWYLCIIRYREHFSKFIWHFNKKNVLLLDTIIYLFSKIRYFREIFKIFFVNIVWECHSFSAVFSY